jgi:hypothetical protein
VTPEGKVKKRVKDVLKSLGAYYAMPVGGGFGNSGVPDFLICMSGTFVGIETKANGGKPTALQEKNLEQIRQAGGVALVIDEKNVTELETILRNIK